MQEGLRVIVADDHKIFRVGMVSTLKSIKSIQYICQAQNGQEVLDILKKEPIDIIFMDIKMPVMNGIDVRRRILGDERCVDVRILILTTFDLDEYVYAAQQVGPADSS